MQIFLVSTHRRSFLSHYKLSFLSYAQRETVGSYVQGRSEEDHGESPEWNLAILYSVQGRSACVEAPATGGNIAERLKLFVQACPHAKTHSVCASSCHVLELAELAALKFCDQD